jgi:predicted phage terminase large subunit-like protein
MLRKKFSEKKFEIRALEILERMKADARPFSDSEEEKRERVLRASTDKFYFFQTYLPHYFFKPPAEFHKELLEYADIEGEPVFLTAPREHAKSTLCTLGVPLHDIIFEKKHFIIIVSDTEDLAADFCQFIQMELESNERLRGDFGDLIRQGFWKAEDFTTRNGVRVKARGRGQRIRGLRNRQYRPDRIIIDDLENDKNVRNPRLVKETIDWMLTTVLGSMAEDCSFLMIGTLLSRKSVLAEMMNMKAEDDPEKPRFFSKIYRAIDEFNCPLWPEAWSVERLQKRKAQMGSVRFNQEMMNDPRDDEGLFREEWIRYYHPDEIIGKTLRKYTAIDPSMESGASNDYKAIITIGIDLDGIIYVLDAFIRHCSVDTMARVGYTRYEEFNPLVMSMEENALGEFASSPFKLAAVDKKYQLPLKGIKQTIAKESRIGRISPHVERGLIRFRKGHSDQDLLVEQLIYFPSSTVNDDGPDALEGAVDLAEKGAYQAMQYKSLGKRRMAVAGAY